MRICCQARTSHFWLLFLGTLRRVATVDTVEIETGDGDPTGSVIWLHGLGADGHDFEPIVGELRLPDDLPLRFVFPHAPVRPVTINGGLSMRAWYDIVSLDRDGPADEAGIRASGAILDELIRRERDRGIDAERIVVAGFSQGGAIALHAALRYPERLAGVMALSTYLPLQRTLRPEVLDNPDAANADIPIFMAHGSFDPVLPMPLGRMSADLLIETGFTIEWHDYPMPHAVCAEEIEDIRNWLAAVYGVVKA